MKASKFEVPAHAVCSGSVLHDTSYSSNWAGHTLPNSDLSGTPTFDTVNSEWVQPSVVGQSKYPNSDWPDAPTASVWTGISNSSSIIQAGIDATAVATPVYKFWTEDYPAGTNYYSIAIHPGDKVLVNVEYVGGNDTAVYFVNETTGGYIRTGLATPYVADSTADFIIERLGCWSLAHFSTFKMSVNQADGPSGSWYITPNINHKIIMTADGSPTSEFLAEPGAVNADGKGTGDFTTPWSAGGSFGC
jgi:hypothetical protein